MPGAIKVIEAVVAKVSVKNRRRVANRCGMLTAMKLTDEKIPGLNLVTAYSATEVRIAEKVVNRSCIVTADRLLTDFRPQTLAELTLADLEPVFALDPEIVVIGTGPRQHFPDTSLMGAVLSRGIGCEAMDTGAACRTFNVLVSEDRRAAAVLFLKD
jgi:uncharacterized protein